jgi:hypothetical protein
LLPTAHIVQWVFLGVPRHLGLAFNAIKQQAREPFLVGLIIVLFTYTLFRIARETARAAF